MNNSKIANVIFDDKATFESVKNTYFDNDHHHFIINENTNKIFLVTGFLQTELNCTDLNGIVDGMELTIKLDE